MCWIAFALGITMLFVGALLLVRALASRRPAGGDLADATRAEGLLLGVVLVSIGFLLSVFGGTGALCQWLGLAW